MNKFELHVQFLSDFFQIHEITDPTSYLVGEVKWLSRGGYIPYVRSCNLETETVFMKYLTRATLLSDQRTHPAVTRTAIILSNMGVFYMQGVSNTSETGPLCRNF